MSQPFNAKSILKGIIPMELEDSTQKFVDDLNVYNEKNKIKPYTLTTKRNITCQKKIFDLEDKYFPASQLTDNSEFDFIINDEIFTDEIVFATNNLSKVVENDFKCYLYQYSSELPNIINGKDLLMVCISENLEVSCFNQYPRPFPFLLHFHPLPHNNPELYSEPNDPWHSSWLRQFIGNIKRLTQNISKDDKQYVYVIPRMSYTYTSLMEVNKLNRCLLGIQKAYFDKYIINVEAYALPEINFLTIEAFSSGNDALEEFIKYNKEKSFFITRIKEFIIFDPPKNSLIIDKLRNSLSKKPKIQLFTQTRKFIDQLGNFEIKEKKNHIFITIDKYAIYLEKSIWQNSEKTMELFTESKIKSIQNKNIEHNKNPKNKNKFPTDYDSIIWGLIHNYIPKLFLREAINSSGLEFLIWKDDGQVPSERKYPNYPTLEL